MQTLQLLEPQPPEASAGDPVPAEGLTEPAVTEPNASAELAREPPGENE